MLRRKWIVSFCLPLAFCLFVFSLVLYPFFYSPPPAHAASGITIDSHDDGQDVPVGLVRVSGHYVDGARCS